MLRKNKLKPIDEINSILEEANKKLDAVKTSDEQEKTITLNVSNNLLYYAIGLLSGVGIILSYIVILYMLIKI